MKVIVLPGNSLKNRDWAIQVADFLKPEFETKIIEWEHWKTGVEAGLDPKVEISKVSAAVGNDRVHIIAKSIGTWIIAQMLPDFKDKIDKMVFVGVPVSDLSGSDKESYQVMADFPADKLLIIQNEHDNHGSPDQVSQFLSGINPQIKVEVRPRSDHDYPYLEEFKNFLE